MKMKQKKKRAPKKAADAVAARVVPSPAPVSATPGGSDAPKVYHRPVGLTPEIHAEIVRNIRSSGCSLDDAAGMVGFDGQTISNWRSRGRAGEEPFVGFFVDTERARIAAKIMDLSSISRAAVGRKPGTNGKADKGAEPDWRAAAWRLERQHPKEFAQRVYNVVDEQLDAAVRRVEEVFKNEPELLERISNALAGSQVRPAGIEAPIPAAGESRAGGAGVDAVPAVAAATGIPRP